MDDGNLRSIPISGNDRGNHRTILSYMQSISDVLEAPGVTEISIWADFTDSPDGAGADWYKVTQLRWVLPNKGLNPLAQPFQETISRVTFR